MTVLLFVCCFVAKNGEFPYNFLAGFALFSGFYCCCWLFCSLTLSFVQFFIDFWVSFLGAAIEFSSCSNVRNSWYNQSKSPTRLRSVLPLSATYSVHTILIGFSNIYRAFLNKYVALRRALKLSDANASVVILNNEAIAIKLKCLS